MRTHTASPAFTVADLAPCRAFFVDHFQARVTFAADCYLNLEVGGKGSSLQFMTPLDGSAPPAGYPGVWLNFEVDDVDAEHARLSRSGLAMRMPLEDHPWGDRGFAIAGPLDLTLYVFSPREPAPEFKGCYLP